MGWRDHKFDCQQFHCHVGKLLTLSLPPVTWVDHVSMPLATIVNQSLSLPLATSLAIFYLFIDFASHKEVQSCEGSGIRSKKSSSKRVNIHLPLSTGSVIWYWPEDCNRGDSRRYNKRDAILMCVQKLTQVSPIYRTVSVIHPTAGARIRNQDSYGVWYNYYYY